MQRMDGSPRAGMLVLMLCLVLASPMVGAGDSGGVQSSDQQMSLIPESPTMGSSMDVEVRLYNSQASEAFGVQYSFYKDFISSGTRLKTANVDIPAGEVVTVSATWSGLTEGDHQIWFEFEAGSDAPFNFHRTFTVLGLPNLRIQSAEVLAEAPIYAGDEVDLAISVVNSGTEDADASDVLLEVPGQTDRFLATPALAAGASAWVNTTVTAPASGEQTLTLTPDAHNAVAEASEQNKATALTLNVATRMDVSFLGDLTITSPAGALQGPWTVEGVLERTNGTGQDDVPVRLEVATPNGGTVTAPPFTVTMFGSGYSQQPFTTEINMSTLFSLPDGDHVLTARINPFNDPEFVQESTDNDVTTGSLTISPIPDVYVDAVAIPTTPSVRSGDDVEWRVTMENTGDITVSGTFQYTFDGLDGSSPTIFLPAGASFTWTDTLSTELGAHTAVFNGQWVPAQGSWDDNRQNSVASGSVLVESSLQLDWELSSLQLLDTDGELASNPLTDGDAYTLNINMTSRETGTANFTCEDGDTNVLALLQVSVVGRGDRVSVSCTFTARAALSTLRIVPEDPSISSTFTRSFATLAPSEGTGDGTAASGAGTMALFGLGAVVLIGVLVAAVLLTREREDEVDRDIFDYCPSCDGELEGDEDRCPHCMFNLKKARAQFHDCHECGESIPDLLENCAYCGAFQDVSSFFERRERRERRTVEKTTVALPEEEDDDRIVTGTQNFADAVKDFGFDEAHLEDEWDTNIEAAEAEVEAAYDRRNAEALAMEDMTEDELEAYNEQVTTTLKGSGQEDATHDIDAILASKDTIVSLGEDKGDLSASDADIRERLFEITGEDGVLPGDKVQVGMSLTDSSLAGNEVAEAKANFMFEDDEPLSASTESLDNGGRASTKARQPRRRRAPKREDPAPEMGECGACGADLALDADECGTCGAKFG